ncbi:hypothetical protein OIU78_024135 [Salix suchowensis]|nr:hypothetical protein OIU78_024135 [Salix suchowensis]
MDMLIHIYIYIYIARLSFDFFICMIDQLRTLMTRWWRFVWFMRTRWRSTRTSRRRGGMATRGRGFTMWWTRWWWVGLWWWVAGLVAALWWWVAGLVAALWWGGIVHLLSFLLLIALRWC